METKRCAACALEQPRSQFAPFKKSKDGLYSYCRACVRLRNVKFYAENRERERARASAYRAANRQEVLAGLARWHEENREHSVAYRARNADRFNERSREWSKANPDIKRRQWQKRRAVERQATPSWANRFFMAEAYRLARLRTSMLGQGWHVDHIVPLQSDLVCGLHCEANLRVIPAPDNRAKFNTYWPDMPV
jgi:hypothetical protein